MPGLAIAACTTFTDFSSTVAATTAAPKRIAHASNAALPTGRYAELVEVRAGWKSCASGCYIARPPRLSPNRAKAKG